MNFIRVGGKRLEYVRLPSSHPNREAPSLVFLHEGLGSISMWRDFPQAVADACGCEAIVYSRYGYGRSDPLVGKRSVAYMHDEALQVLPEFLDRLDVEEPVLLGHSDGGSIALIHAGGAGRAVSGLVLMAPHVMVEDLSIASICAARDAYRTTELAEKLGRHHDDVDSAFVGWNDIWLDPEFRGWNIEEYLPRITCPVLAIQGEDDEYGTMEQIHRIARVVGDLDVLSLADCRHSPHKDQPEAVIGAVSAFVRRLIDARESPAAPR